MSLRDPSLLLYLQYNRLCIVCIILATGEILNNVKIRGGSIEVISRLQDVQFCD